MKKNNSSYKFLIIILSIVVVAIILLSIYFIVNKKEFKNNNIKDNIVNEVPENKNENDNSSLPTLILNDVIINESENYNIRDFVKSCTDKDGKKCIVKYLSKEMNNYKEAGTYNIVIVSIDSNDQKVEKSCILKIRKLNENVENNDKTDENNTFDKKSNNENNSNNVNQNVDKNKNTEQNNVNNNTNNNTNNNQTTTKPNNNQTTTKQNTTTKQKTTERYKVDNLTETNEKVSYKYGTKITEVTYYYYNVYSDSSKELISSNVEYIYDYNSYNASTNDLKNEATSLSSQNYGIYNSVLNYVNGYRSEVGVENLSLDTNLSIAATIRALEMAWSNKFSHDRPNGSSCFSVLNDLGINYYSVGENIAWGYWDAASVSEGWKNSPGHYANMISSNFSKIGIGYAVVDGERYWVQIFTN